MGSTITARYPFSGKNQFAVEAEEIAVTTAYPVYGKNRSETLTGTTPNGSATWKTLGYVTGGSTVETRTIEEIATIGRRNIQQLAETKFECSGSLETEYQNGRALYFAISPNNSLGSNTAPGIYHSDAVVTGLDRHIIYEPEINCGSTTSTGAGYDVTDAIPDIASFNLVDGYTLAGTAQEKITRKYLGCKIDSLALTFAKDGSVKQSINWKGAQVYASQATTTTNLLTSDQLSYQEIFPPVFGSLYIADWTYPTATPTWTAALDTSLAGAGNRIGDLQTCKVNISNNLEPLFVIGDITARAMVPQARKYDGTFNMAFCDEAQHAEFLGTLGTSENTYATDPSTAASVLGTGTWGYPWYAANRENYRAMKILYDNSSLGYTSASANYRKIELTLLGAKIREHTTPKSVNGIIYQDFSWQATMLAPFNKTDNVGGIVLYDNIASTDFHSTQTGIV